MAKIDTKDLDALIDALKAAGKLTVVNVEIPERLDSDQIKTAMNNLIDTLGEMEAKIGAEMRPKWQKLAETREGRSELMRKHMELRLAQITAALRSASPLDGLSCEASTDAYILAVILGAALNHVERVHSPKATKLALEMLERVRKDDTYDSFDELLDWLFAQRILRGIDADTGYSTQESKTEKKEVVH